MLMIRSDQMKVFEDLARTRFVTDMATYIRDYLPEKYQELGADDVRKQIQIGIERATLYGASSEIATAQHIELMFTFSQNQSDPPPEWISRLLEEDSQNADRTIEYIYSTANDKGTVTGHLLQSSAADAGAG